jgi:hypothetical protein
MPRWSRLVVTPAVPASRRTSWRSLSRESPERELSLLAPLDVSSAARAVRSPSRSPDPLAQAGISRLPRFVARTSQTVSGPGACNEIRPDSDLFVWGPAEPRANRGKWPRPTACGETVAGPQLRSYAASLSAEKRGGGPGAGSMGKPEVRMARFMPSGSYFLRVFRQAST